MLTQIYLYTDRGFQNETPQNVTFARGLFEVKAVESLQVQKKLLPLS